MTAQVGDRLLIDGHGYTLQSEPLRPYIAQHAQGVTLSPTNTANYRGYRAIWELIEDKLYLISLIGQGQYYNHSKFKEGRLELRRKLREGNINPIENGILLRELEKKCTTPINFNLDYLFGTNEKVFANWVTGNIIIPYGEILDSFDMGYLSTFENERWLEFNNGILIKTTEKKNKKEDAKF